VEQVPKIEKTKLVAASPAPEEVSSKNEFKEKEVPKKGVGFIPYMKNMFSSSEKQQSVLKKPEVKKVDVKESG